DAQALVGEVANARRHGVEPIHPVRDRGCVERAEAIDELRVGSFDLAANAEPGAGMHGRRLGLADHRHSPCWQVTAGSRTTYPTLRTLYRARTHLRRDRGACIRNKLWMRC